MSSPTSSHSRIPIPQPRYNQASSSDAMASGSTRSSMERNRGYGQSGMNGMSHLGNSGNGGDGNEGGYEGGPSQAYRGAGPSGGGSVGGSGGIGYGREGGGNAGTKGEGSSRQNNIVGDTNNSSPQEYHSQLNPNPNSQQYAPDPSSSRDTRLDPGGPAGDPSAWGGSASERLPRITTTSGTPDEDGPRSAPISGSLRPPVLQTNGPMRSSSSPDPWTSSHQSEKSSPVDSRAPPLLGNPYYPPGNAQNKNQSQQPSLQFPTPQLPAPPRKSSHHATQQAPSASLTGRFTQNQQPSSQQSSFPPQQQSHHSHQGYQTHGGLDRQERTLGSQSSHQSLTDSQPTHSEAAQSDTTSRDNRDKDRGDRERVGRSKVPTYCGQCGQVVHGPFVRAMSKVYHLDCFKCKDCGKVVAQKFFPVEDPEGMYPLCERDYFARLDMICAKCDQALRSNYITACGEKYHVEHFTCHECDVVFGPNDAYYEHAGKVYCHFHYSTRFAVKCVGCEMAILKQFVELNRNGKDECWHPECYMISKFWNVRLASKNFSTPANSAVNSSISLLEMTPNASLGSASPVNTVTGAQSTVASPISTDQLTPAELKDRQESVETKVLQIWHVLSGYEESSAALIGEMLVAVNGRNLLEIVLLAERFILHVEALFAVIDDLEAQFALAGLKGMAHAREAKQLCRKLVNLFSTMSQISPSGPSQPSNQDLYTLITQIAHYLKILIRIALTGSIKLEREQGHSAAMINALARLNLLSMDGSDPTLKKRGDYPEVAPWDRYEKSDNGSKDGTATPASGTGVDEEQLKRAIEVLPRRPKGYIPSTQDIAYGYRSLSLEATQETTLRGPQEEDFVPPEGCAHCHLAIEEDCVRLGMFVRWHSPCVQCVVCGDRAVPLQMEDEDANPKYREDGSIIAQTKPKRPPPRVGEFFFSLPIPPSKIFCTQHRGSGTQSGFESVSRLEQYAFLLHIALRRLYVHFRIHHSLPSGRFYSCQIGSSLRQSVFRGSAADGLVRDHGLGGFDVAQASGRDPEMKRMKSVVTLDRKLSSTARLPQRSTVVESPAGRIAKEDGRVVSARSREASPPRITTDDGNLDQGEKDEPPGYIEEPPASATVDVIRPPFARNNTSVMVINENGPELPDEVIEQLQTHQFMQEDDAITLGDIPSFADATIRHRAPDSRPLLSSLNHLQSLILKHFALLSLQKSGLGHLIEIDDILELLDARKSQWWNKLFKGNAKEKQKKKGVFGVPLEILVDRTGSDSQQGASNVQLRVPEFIEEIIATMRQMDMAVEGIFRKNGNIRRLQQISEALDKDSTNVNLWEENPVQLAALLKRFLRELPDPLLTFKLHKLFCAAASFQQAEERQRCLHLLICLLPRCNRDTMEVLFVFLKWVASFSYKDEETGSRMDMANLATVICPSILFAKGANAARDESFIAITAVQELLENQDEYYTVPAELLFVINEHIYTIFAKELDLPPKEIHRHCSKYMQARGAGLQGVAGVGAITGGMGSMSMQGGQGGSSQRIPTSLSGPVGRQTDSRLSVHRSDGNLSGGLGMDTPVSATSPINLPPNGSGGGGVPIGNHSPYRPTPSPTNNTNPHHGSRPVSWIQSNPGSQNSLNLASGAGGMGGGSMPNSAPWRGPFQGVQGGGTGSRNSSRGSAPSSPGPDERGRGSMQIEREGRRTPLQSDHR